AGPHLGARDPGRLPGRRRRVLRDFRKGARGGVLADGCPLPGNSKLPPAGSSWSMSTRAHRRLVRFAAAAAAAILPLAIPSGAFGQPAQQQQTQVSTEGGEFPLSITAEYLGMAGMKTVVRVRMRAPE